MFHNYLAYSLSPKTSTNIVMISSIKTIHFRQRQPTNAVEEQKTWDKSTKKTRTNNPFNGPLSGTTRVSRYQKGKTNLDFTEARDSEWQWHQLGHT